MGTAANNKPSPFSIVMQDVLNLQHKLHCCKLDAQIHERPNNIRNGDGQKQASMASYKVYVLITIRDLKNSCHIQLNQSSIKDIPQLSEVDSEEIQMGVLLFVKYESADKFK